MDQEILDEIKSLMADMDKRLDAIERNQKEHVGTLLDAISSFDSEMNQMNQRFNDSEGGLLQSLSTKG